LPERHATDTLHAVCSNRRAEHYWWRIHFPKNDQLRESVNHFQEKYSNYVNALNKLRKDTRNDPATKEGFEQELRNKLEASK
jgi:hypothetical protein